MIARIPAPALVCLVLWLAPADASAQRVADVLAKWGLLGTWAVDCTAPPARNNTHTTYIGRLDQSAYYTREWGDGKDQNANEIDSASVRDGGMLVMTETMRDFNNQKREFWLLRGPDGRARAWMNRQIDGDYTVRDGKFTASGRDTPWSSRCW